MVPLQIVLLNLCISTLFMWPAHCKPTGKIPNALAKVLSVAPEKLSPSPFNMCEDFLHVIKDQDTGSNSVNPDVKRSSVDADNWPSTKDVIQDLMKTNWKKEAGKQLRRFTKKYIPCKRTAKMLKKQKIEDYIAVSHTERKTASSLAKIYIQASRISFLLGILNSTGTEQCCLQDKQLTGLVSQFKNKFIANMFGIVSREMGSWTYGECYMRVTMTTKQPMRCEDVTHVISVVLKDSVNEFKRLSKRMKRELKSL